MVLNTGLLILGIILLYVGSEWMVRGAASLAFALSIRPIIVGLTVVAFATSAPELLVSIVAALRGSSGVSLGNILGSNVANIGLVLGSSALVRPLAVDRGMLTREIPFLLAATTAFWVVCADGHIGKTDGIFLLCGLGAFLVMGFVTAKSAGEDQADVGRGEKKIAWQIFLVFAGMGGLMAGAHLVVISAIFIARQVGLSETFIGLSIVALGTSLPELATSVVAGAKGEHDISVGNVVGSNVFNICMVIGAIGLFNPMAVDMGLMRFEFPAMMALTVLLWVFSRTGFVISRLEGLFLVAGFFSFIGLSYWIGNA